MVSVRKECVSKFQFDKNFSAMPLNEDNSHLLRSLFKHFCLLVAWKF